MTKGKRNLPAIANSHRPFLEILFIILIAVFIGLYIQNRSLPETSFTDEEFVENERSEKDSAEIYPDDAYFAPQDLEKVTLNRDPIRQDISNTQYRLGVSYEKGYGVPQNFKISSVWYESAANLGHKYAQYNLGIFYFKGMSVEKDYKKAADLFQKAAEQGLEQAQYNLGFMYEEGLGVKRDYDKAYKWYLAASEADFKMAKDKLKIIEKKLRKR